MTVRVHAPELESGLVWLNVDRALTMAELRGCVVVLDFWTYCCVNCLHVLPTLRALEERHEGEPLVVVGVHSGKFSAEHDPERVRAAIARYGVEHPVVVDDDMSIWSRYAIRSWPTLVVVRPDGTIAAVAPGEPDLELLDAFVRREMEEARQAGTLRASPPMLSGAALEPTGPLRFPGKASLLPDGKIAISDSGHHRVLVVEPTGEVVFAIGSGTRGLQDGSFESAAFDDPQGTAWHDGALYVADTRNHAIRRADLDARVVTTVAGTGELGVTMPKRRAFARDVALRSPWDLCSVGDAIYVAMAGSHQIWRYWPSSGDIEPYAGIGAEALIDGPVAKSAWAQPSGLSAHDGRLYVADSETSAVRSIDLASGIVETLIGEGLFDFGDEEGDAAAARLQHALGVAAAANGVFIADTYNGKIKHMAGGQEVRTVAAGLAEPGSVVADREGRLLVADTNAHRIVWIGPGGEPMPVAITKAPEPRRDALPRRRRPRARLAEVEGWFTTLLQLPEGTGLRPGAAEIRLTLGAAAGSELSTGTPIRVGLEVSRRSDLVVLKADQLELLPDDGSAVVVPIAVDVSELPDDRIEAEIVVTAEYVACSARDHDVCYPGRVHVRVPVRLLKSGADRLELKVALPPAATDAGQPAGSASVLHRGA